MAHPLLSCGSCSAFLWLLGCSASIYTMTGIVRSLCGWCVRVAHPLLSCGSCAAFLWLLGCSASIYTMTGIVRGRCGGSCGSWFHLEHRAIISNNSIVSVFLMTGIVRGWCAGSVAHPLLSCGCLFSQLISTMSGMKEACAVGVFLWFMRCFPVAVWLLSFHLYHDRDS